MKDIISRNVLPFSTNAKYGECLTCQTGGGKKQKGGSIASLLQSLFPTVTVNKLMTTAGLVTASKVRQSKKRKTTKCKTTKRKTTKRKKSKKSKK